MYGGVLQLKFDNNGFSDHRSWRKAKQELLWHILFYFGGSGSAVPHLALGQWVYISIGCRVRVWALPLCCLCCVWCCGWVLSILCPLFRALGGLVGFGHGVGLVLGIVLRGLSECAGTKQCLLRV